MMPKIEDLLAKRLEGQLTDLEKVRGGESYYQKLDGMSKTAKAYKEIKSIRLEDDALMLKRQELEVKRNQMDAERLKAWLGFTADIFRTVCGTGMNVFSWYMENKGVLPGNLAKEGYRFIKR